MSRPLGTNGAADFEQEAWNLFRKFRELRELRFHSGPHYDQWSALIPTGHYSLFDCQQGVLLAKISVTFRNQEWSTRLLLQSLDDSAESWHSRAFSADEEQKARQLANEILNYLKSISSLPSDGEFRKEINTRGLWLGERY